MSPTVDEKKRTIRAQRNSYAPNHQSTRNNGLPPVSVQPEIDHQPLRSATIARAQLHPQSLHSSDVLNLQRTIGNQQVQRLLLGSTGIIQRNPDENSENTDDLVLDTGEFDLGETQGFELIDEDQGLQQERRRYQPQQSSPKPKQSLKSKFKRFGRQIKGLAKSHTVYSYGKIGIHAMINRDEKTISKAERLIHKKAKSPEEAEENLREARNLLQNRIYRVTKQDISEIGSLGKGIAIALAAPIWFTRWQIAHARWKSLAKKVGILLPTEKKTTEPIVPEENEPQAPQETPWQRGRQQVKDTFTELHTWMLGGDTFKGKGMSNQQKFRERQKWRMREMDDPTMMVGKHRHTGWMPGHSRDAYQRDETPGVQVGGHRPEWRYGHTRGRTDPGFQIGQHRPVWGFAKPGGDQSTKFSLGKHRPVWNAGKLDGDHGSKFTIGGYRPKWGFEKPGGTQDYSAGLGGHRLRPTWMSANTRHLHLPGSTPEMGWQRDPEQSVDEPDVEETTTPDTPTTTALQEGEIYTLEAPLTVIGTRSKVQQTIEAGAMVYITDIRDGMARADANNQNRTNGYAPVTAIMAAIGS